MGHDGYQSTGDVRHPFQLAAKGQCSGLQAGRIVGLTQGRPIGCEKTVDVCFGVFWDREFFKSWNNWALGLGTWG